MSDTTPSLSGRVTSRYTSIWRNAGLPRHLCRVTDLIRYSGTASRMPQCSCAPVKFCSDNHIVRLSTRRSTTSYSPTLRHSEHIARATSDSIGKRLPHPPVCDHSVRRVWPSAWLENLHTGVVPRNAGIAAVTDGVCVPGSNQFDRHFEDAPVPSRGGLRLQRKRPGSGALPGGEEGGMGVRTRRGVVIALAGAVLVMVLEVAGSTGAGATSSPRLNTTVGTSGCIGPVQCVANLSFGNVPVGTHMGPDSFWLNNDYTSTVTVDLSTGVSLSGPGANDYVLQVPGCAGSSTGTITMTPGYSCLIDMTFYPGAPGDRSATMTINASAGAPTTVDLSGTGTPNILSFGETTLGTYAGPDTFSLQNDGSSTDTVDLFTNDLSLAGPGADDYVVTPSSDCPGNGVNTIVLAAGAACTMNVTFYPGALGDRSATMTIRGSVGTEWLGNLSGTGTIGYYQVDSEGNVATAGDAGYYGDPGGTHLNQPIVGMAATGDDGGYWLVARDGGIFSYGDAVFHGSPAGPPQHADRRNDRAPDAGGYWFVASDGGIFSYGDAQFYGSTVAPSQPADRGHGRHPGRPRLLARGLRRRDIRLRRRPVLRLHGGSISTNRSWAWPPPPTATATGSWPPTAEYSPTAAPGSTDRRRYPSEQAHRGHGGDADWSWLLVQRGGRGIIQLR